MLEVKNPKGSLIQEDMFVCTRCKKEKRSSEYYFRTERRKKSGLQIRYSHCKECHKAERRTSYPRHRKREMNWRLRTKYGIGMDEYNLLLKAQGGTCMICGNGGGVRKKGSRNGKAGTPIPLNVDHDHETGKIRGLLCLHCNTGLGHFKDSIDVIKNVIKYLEEQ
tara:strand:+ start:276 stop:770 length:495 start_codon:yes stop_codon:yes gene_type:complete